MKISFRKIFNFISFLFLFSCVVYYGTRFIKYYLENKNSMKISENTLAKYIKDENENNEYFKEINGYNYFTSNADNNYLLYSNILFRIIKVNNDNSITIISENSLSSIAYGMNIDYKDSYAYKWLNNTENEYSGILEKQLHDVSKYLQKTEVCIDKMEELNNNICTNSFNDGYFGLLSSIDYLNVGSKDSYLYNQEYYYLSNTFGDDKVWYINSNGSASLGFGNDSYGIRPVATIKANINYISGNGMKDNPYIIEENNGLFGSYVKLDNELFRIYEVNDDYVRVMLNDYLEVYNDTFKYKFSNTSSYYDDTKSGTIAYYLNHNYLNRLSYKDKIKEVEWTNGYYGESSDYDYSKALENTINSKVSLMSIGNIFLNNTLSNYLLNTGTTDKGNYIYTYIDGMKITNKNIINEAKVVPVFSLDKELLKNGDGTKDNPFTLE